MSAGVCLWRFGLYSNVTKPWIYYLVVSWAFCRKLQITCRILQSAIYWSVFLHSFTKQLGYSKITNYALHLIPWTYLYKVYKSDMKKCAFKNLSISQSHICTIIDLIEANFNLKLLYKSTHHKNGGKYKTCAIPIVLLIFIGWVPSSSTHQPLNT